MNARPVIVPDTYNDGVDDDAPVQAALARLPAPRSPDILMEKLLALGLDRDHVVLDLGCGHGQHALQMAKATGCRVVALDQSASSAAETRARAQNAQLARVHAGRAVAEALPFRPRSVAYIWCRDMLYHVDLPCTLRDCARALAPGGYMVTYQSFATERMEPLEESRLYPPTRNMSPAYFEACARDAGFTIVERDTIGGEWREFAETRGYDWGGGGLGAGLTTSDKLMRAEQLIRGEGLLRAELGDAAYEAALADCLWAVYQMIGKLCPMIYVLRRE